MPVKDVLGRVAARVPAIRFSEVPLSRVMAAILNLPETKAPGQILSIDFPGGTLLEALNALVRSQPAMWHAIPDGEKVLVSVLGLFSRRLP